MNKKIKTAVILAGGKGTRMREHPEVLPKPMIKIGGKPVLMHIMDYLSSFQDFNFIIEGEEYLEDGIPHIKMLRN